MNVFACYDELVNPSPARIDKVLRRSVQLQTLLYVVVAFCGYISFGEATPDNILVAYPSHNMFANVGKACVTLQLLLAIPLTVHPGRTYLWPLLGLGAARPDDGAGETGSESSTPFSEAPLDVTRDIPTGPHVLITAGFLLVSVAVAIAVPSAADLTGIVGGFACVTYVFLLPAEMATKLRRVAGNDSRTLLESPAAFLAGPKASFCIAGLRICGVMGYIAAAQSAVSLVSGKQS
jgi:amino acid permease